MLLISAYEEVTTTREESTSFNPRRISEQDERIAGSKLHPSKIFFFPRPGLNLTCVCVARSDYTKSKRRSNTTGNGMYLPVQCYEPLMNASAVKGASRSGTRPLSDQAASAVSAEPAVVNKESLHTPTVDKIVDSNDLPVNVNSSAKPSMAPNAELSKSNADAVKNQASVAEESGKRISDNKVDQARVG